MEVPAHPFQDHSRHQGRRAGDGGSLGGCPMSGNPIEAADELAAIRERLQSRIVEAKRDARDELILFGLRHPDVDLGDLLTVPIEEPEPPRPI